ncbi:hypothetical protein C0Q70_09374 [Pomacea canaliculata]|uniref:Uncharacterized protein n=1 Tax=Pomacea canaliculata TaxID=400727 RepID=A0A2T7P9L9_POMCA|nr:hypothetical protein C0Q70_09374 [Pomacea canaliculata]
MKICLVLVLAIVAAAAAAPTEVDAKIKLNVDELIKQLTEFVKDNADGASEFCMELCVKYAGLLSFGCNSICDL